jgi:pimeloyl-ACP methyl ester carboxylesterase
MKFVLLPGMDGTGDLYDAFAAAAPDDFEPMVISYPTDEVLGYREYVDFVESQLPKGSPFVLLGESFSGPIAILLAARRPAGLQAVVLCNTFASGPWWRGFRHLPWRLLLGLPAPAFTLAYFLCGLSGASRFAGRIQVANDRVRPEVRASRLREALTVDVRPQLAELSCPILYLKGTRDRLVRSRSLREIQWTNPAVRVARFDAPHILLQMRPKSCWQAISDFIETSCADLGHRGDTVKR